MTRLELEINSLFMAYKRQQEESERKFLEEIQTICESCLNEVSQYAEIKSDPSEKWLRASELAEYFNVSPSTVYDWEKRGVIPKGTQFGKRQNRWKVSEVEKFLKNKNQPSDQRNVSVILNVSKKSTRGRKSRIQKLKELQHV